MFRPSHLALPLLVIACLWCSCIKGSDGSDHTTFVLAASISPPPGASEVSRRAEARVVLDTEVDPASISAATCQLERVDGGGTATTTATYDPAARLLTIVPRRALDPSTTYRARLPWGLRAANGDTIEWSFTTDDKLVWDRSEVLASGRLVACEPSRRGGVLAVWVAPDEDLQFNRHDGSDWSPRVPVGLTFVHAADVADDTTGRVVVAASTDGGLLQVAAADTGLVFAAAETVATTVSAHVDVDASDSGHIVLGYVEDVLSGRVRMFVPGTGWAPAHTIFGGFPHVRLQPAGNGVAVAGFKTSSGGGSSSTSCAQFAADALGTWTAIDPLPGPFLGFFVPLGSQARFQDDRVLLGARWTPSPFGTTPVWERTPAGWQALAPVLGPDLDAADIAQGPMGTAAVALIEAGARPLLRRRGEVGFTFELVGSEQQPAPPNPTVGVAITNDHRTHLLWTAAVDGSAAAQVRLMSAWIAPDGSASEPLVVDGPFAPDEVPVQNLRVVAFGASSALALWSRHGEIRFSLLH